MMKKVIKSIIFNLKNIIVKKETEKIKPSSIERKYTATPIFPNKEIMEDAMKRI